MTVVRHMAIPTWKRVNHSARATMELRKTRGFGRDRQGNCSRGRLAAPAGEDHFAAALLLRKVSPKRFYRHSPALCLYLLALITVPARIRGDRLNPASRLGSGELRT